MYAYVRGRYDHFCLPNILIHMIGRDRWYLINQQRLEDAEALHRQQVYRKSGKQPMMYDLFVVFSVTAKEVVSLLDA